MSQKKEIEIFPAKWPFEEREEYLQACAQSAEWHKKFRKALSKKENKKEFYLDDLEFVSCFKVFSGHYQFTAIHLTTKEFYEVKFLNPVTVSDHKDLERVIQEVGWNQELVYSEYFVDTKWELLQDFNKFSYCYVMVFKKKAYNEALLYQIFERDLSEVTEVELEKMCEEFYWQTTVLSNEDRDSRLSNALKNSPHYETNKKAHPQIDDLLSRLGSKAKIQDEAAVASGKLQKIKQEIVEDIKKKGMPAEDRLLLAQLLGFLGKFSKTEQILNEMIEAGENKGLLSYLLYYFAGLANQRELKEKYLKQALESSDKSQMNELFVTMLTALQAEVSNKRTEAAAIYESRAQKEEETLLKAILLSNLAGIEYESGVEQCKNAITQYNKAMEIVAAIEPKHIFLPFFALKIAQVYAQLHNYAKAKGVLEDKAIKLTETIYGSDSFEMSQLYKELGILCTKLEMKRTGFDYFEKSLAIIEKEPELYYINITENLNFTALILKEAGDRQGALNQLHKGLKLLKEFGGLISPQRAILLNGMGELLTHMGDFNSALELIENALEINMYSPEKSSQEISRNYLNLGLLYKRMGHDSMAKDFFERCIEIKCGLKGESHFEVGALLNTLAILHRDMMDFDNALSYYQRSIDIYRKYGENHPLIAATLNNMAIINKKIGKLDVALDLYQKSLAIAKVNVGEEHADYAITLNNIAVVYLQKNMDDLALKTMEQAYEILKKVCGENHQTAVNIQQNIIYLKNKVQSKQQEPGQKPEGTGTKEETKATGQSLGDVPLSKNKSSNYYEEEKKEYRAPADYGNDDLPPSLKKNPSKQESQQVSKGQQPDTKPEPKQDSPAQKIPDPKDVVIPELYLQCKSEISKALQNIYDTSPELFRSVVTDSQKFDGFCMGLIDTLEGYYASGSEISEEGVAVLVENYSRYYVSRNYSNFMLAQIISQLQGRGLTVIQVGGEGGGANNEEATQGHPVHGHPMHGHPMQGMPIQGMPIQGHPMMRPRQVELDADDLEAIEQLSGFGFDKEKVKKAYVYCGRDKDVTLDYLFELQESEGNQ